MSDNQTATKSNSTASSKRLSPELSEFLHMLDALEGQIAPRTSTASSTR